MRRPGRRTLTVTLVAAALLMTACSGNEPEKAAAPAASGGSADGPRGKSSGAGIEKVDLGKVLVEQTISLPSSPADRVTLGVLDLQVRDKVMVLRVAITPRFTSEGPSKAIKVSKALGGSFTPKLVDEEHLKEYRLIEQFGPTGWKSDDNNEVVNGKPILAWAYFSAPEDPSTSMDLLVDDFLTFTDVPITQ